MKRQRQQPQKVDVFLRPVDKVGAANMSACFAVNTLAQGKPEGKRDVVVDLQEGDSNLDLGVTVYFIVDGKQAIMYDTQPKPELASSCIRLMEKQNVQVKQIVLSHKHGDHVGGLASPELNNIKVLAQVNTKDDLVAANEAARKKGGTTNRVPDETYTDFKTLSLGETDINVVNFDAHTDDGSGLFINNDVVLMGDECEDNIPFIADAERVQTQKQNLEQRINEIEAQGIKTICPAHGNGATIFNGCFTLDLCKSNLAYLETMTTELQNACDFLERDSNGGSIQEGQALKKLKLLAPGFNMRPEDIREAYGGVHLSNCLSLSEAQGQPARQKGGGQNGGQNGGQDGGQDKKIKKTKKNRNN